MALFKNLEECLKAIKALEAVGIRNEAFYEEKRRLEAEQRIKEEELIFSTMAAHNKYMSPEKEQVIREMTDQLLKEGDDANQPCLLLGKVQCGKTDTFQSIIGLCFDKGIDIAIILTKANNTLSEQTINRLIGKDGAFELFKDNRKFEQKRKVDVYEILDLYRRGGIHVSQLKDSSRKFIIVAKKEPTNLEDLINLFEKDPLMREKRVLICDDEADFASRTYYQRKGKADLMRIAELIETLIKMPKYCRYLQVTATPSSLYLQPDNTIMLRGEKEASVWLPRYTGLVPIHDKYVGGKQYFIDSQEGDWDEDGNFYPANMYGHLFHAVTEDCRQILSSPDDFYKEDPLHSETLRPLKAAIIGYMVATAIRRIQQRKKYEEAPDDKKGELQEYVSSCVIHCEIETSRHKIQSEYISNLIETVRNIIVDDNVHDEHLADLQKDAYDDFERSYNLAKEQGEIDVDFPSRIEVEEELRDLLERIDYDITIVNSANSFKKDDRGQLKLEHAMNFFIGGSILDRGITIDNMLCFFYGRFPSKVQMDTALQHSRMYGNRSKEDMACTRFFTTEDIYDILKTINKFDDYIYEYLKANRGNVQSNDFTRILIGYDPRIAPTAGAKYSPSNTRTVKPKERTYPVGFQTLEADECEPIIGKIDGIIAKVQAENKPDEDGFFLMHYNYVKEILNLIEQTYVYCKDFENLDRVYDFNEMLVPLHHLTFNTDGMVLVKINKEREASRKRSNPLDKRGPFMDAPESGSEVRVDREKAIDRPVVVLLRQKGLEAQGWRNTPFYWPTMTNPQVMQSGVFTLDGNKKFKAPKKQIALETLGNYPKDELLEMPIPREGLFEILAGKANALQKPITNVTARMFLEKDLMGNYLRVEGTDPEKRYHLMSFNNGIFPWEIHSYKYLYLRTSMDKSGSQAIIKLDEEDPYTLLYEEVEDKDIKYDALNNAREEVDKEKCKWYIEYHISDILETKFAGQDEELFEAYINSLDDPQ